MQQASPLPLWLPSPCKQESEPINSSRPALLLSLPTLFWNPSARETYASEVSPAQMRQKLGIHDSCLRIGPQFYLSYPK